MTSWIAVLISAFAFLISALTAWFTLLHKGELRMTQPTVIFIGPDGGRGGGEKSHLKLYLRTLLYSTSRRGQTVESMYVNVQRAESRQNFPIWVYGDGQLKRGSGIYVGPAGVACDHHFLLPEDGSEFKMLPGKYIIRVYGKTVLSRQGRELAVIPIDISVTHTRQLENEDAGIYFDWGPDQQAYHAHVRVQKPKPVPPWLLEAAG